MNIIDDLQTMPNDSWLDMPGEVRERLNAEWLSKSNMRRLLENVNFAFDSEDSNAAANYLFAGFLVKPELCLQLVQSQGVLRSSKRSYDTTFLRPAVKKLLGAVNHLSNDVFEYLKSIDNIYTVAECVISEYISIRAWLELHREEGVKVAIATLDLVFMKHLAGTRFSDKRQHNSRNPDFFDIEELASGLSTILAIHASEFGDLRSNVKISKFELFDDALLRILVGGANIAEFRSWEFEIDRQAYSLRELGSAGCFELRPPSLEYARAVELGFIETAIQRRNRAQKQITTDGRSILKFAADLSKNMEKAGQITFLRDPVKRYRFDLPCDVFEGLNQLPALEDELINLNLAAQDLLTPAQRLLDCELGNDLTFRDLFMFMRLAKVWWGVMATKLMPELAIDYQTVVQSLIPSVPDATLRQIASMAVGNAKAGSLIEMVSLDIHAHVDIQYKPIVPVEGHSWIPTSLLANANLYRNQLQVLRRRLYADGTEDPLSLMLDRTFSNLGYLPKLELKYDGGDVDVLVMIDGLLFALECKNSLLPSDSHELMTSWDYIQTATGQLDRFCERMQESSFRRIITEKTGFNIQSDTRIVTGIVMANRMFSGYRSGKHPVRGGYELVGFVEEGTTQLGEETRSLWQNEKFVGEDLRRFFEEDSTYLPRWNAMHSFSAEYQFGDVSVTTTRMFLNQGEAAENYGFTGAMQLFERQAMEMRNAFSQHSLASFYETGGDFPGPDAAQKKRRARKRKLGNVMKAKRKGP